MHKRVSWSRLLLGLLVITGTLAIAACGAGAGATNSNTPTATAVTATPTTAVTPTTNPSSGYLIKVYFSNNPGTLAVTPVNRMSPTLSVGTYAIMMLIAGPTPEERASGLFSELNNAFSGPSTCLGSLPVGGADFTLTLNMKGTTPSPGTATLKFCRPTTLPGEGAGARIKAEINATLLQFSTVKKVVILGQDGNCWDDLSGQNQCLK